MRGCLNGRPLRPATTGCAGSEGGSTVSFVERRRLSPAAFEGQIPHAVDATDHGGRCQWEEYQWSIACAGRSSHVLYKIGTRYRDDEIDLILESSKVMGEMTCPKMSPGFNLYSWYATNSF